MKGFANTDYHLIRSDVYSNADIVYLVINGNDELENLNDEEEEESCDLEVAAATRKPKKIIGRPSLLESLDEAVKAAVRLIVHDMFHQNELPTLDTVFAQVNSSSELPNMSR
ncbi:hypothetical protein Trydic_g22213 [Trypoxylus dichotomus]